VPKYPDLFAESQQPLPSAVLGKRPFCREPLGQGSRQSLTVDHFSKYYFLKKFALFEKLHYKVIYKKSLPRTTLGKARCFKKY